eukprot:TRINITY_DN2470_c0_g1_i5.p1 TRINITY_DN2470_c0_g1~~TRINITY_DN2470_c0_g1_i5.p1  ORF type:complete len:326 (+),score=35.16 TRINITY_DN2470_c0_g1_i5:65-1042(+)
MCIRDRYQRRVHGDIRFPQVRNLLVKAIIRRTTHLQRMGSKTTKHFFTHRSSPVIDTCTYEHGESTSSKVLLHQKVSGVSISIIHGDICDEPLDVLVNPINSELSALNGITGRIMYRAGERIYNECKEFIDSKTRLENGDINVTGGGSTNSRQIIHVVAPIWSGGDNKDKDNLRDCIERSLERAVELGHKSIGIPAISVGVIGFPRKICANILLTTTIKFIRRYRDDPEGGLRQVKFINFDHPTVRAFCEEYLNLNKGSLVVEDGEPSDSLLKKQASPTKSLMYKSTKRHAYIEKSYELNEIEVSPGLRDSEKVGADEESKGNYK